ncbi:MAG: transketolase [Bacteroidales bacterium]|nr:transketolase [Bacteroidales bacterium]
MNIKELTLLSERSRLRLLEVIYRSGAGHTGGDLSSLNVMTALYHRVLRISPATLDDPDRDRFVLSKGHCAEALYVTLESAGILEKSVLDSYGQFGCPLGGHPTNDLPGVEVNTGALGHGLSIGIGMALAAKMDGKSYRTFVLMGDGEQGEGSIYEAAMAGSHYHLDNLLAIIDRNGLQISGSTEDVMALEDIKARWTAFGWDVRDMDGDDMADVVKTIEATDWKGGRPHLIISHTTKGKGVSYMENVAKWHHGVPDEAQYAQAVGEISARIKKLEEEKA